MNGFSAEIRAWDESKNSREFVSRMLQLGWKKHGKISCKQVLLKGGVIAKFDDNIDRRDYNKLSSHTRAEWLQWKRASPKKRKYLARSYCYHDGLLLQQRIDDPCPDIRGRCDVCDEAEGVAHKIRILDFFNHGTLGGKLKFFDTDSSGSGWWNWKARR